MKGIECLKDGEVFDMRYGAKLKTFERPHVMVFANCKPIFDAATSDRWNIFEIDHEPTLESHRLYVDMECI